MGQIGIVFDVHQTFYWKKAADKLRDGGLKRLIFVGDYFDSHESITLTGDQAISNLEEILSLKKEFPKAVKLLWGNHEFQYLFDSPCDPYNSEYAEKFKNILEKNKEYFNILTIAGVYTVSHAGISIDWMKLNNCLSCDDIEKLFQENPRVFDDCTLTSGQSTQASPLWIRPDYLLKQPFFNYQIVGHSPFLTDKPIEIRNNKNGVIVFGDNAQHNGYYEFDEYACPPQGETYMNVLRRIKKEIKLKNDKKAEIGTKTKALMDKYNISESQMSLYKVMTWREKEVCEEHGVFEFDFWKELEKICMSDTKGNKNE